MSRALIAADVHTTAKPERVISVCEARPAFSTFSLPHSCHHHIEIHAVRRPGVYGVCWASGLRELSATHERWSATLVRGADRPGKCHAGTRGVDRGSVQRDRLYRWRGDGTWDRILTYVQMRLDVMDEVVWEVSIDSSTTRAHQHATGARRRRDSADEKKGRSLTRRGTRTQPRRVDHQVPPRL
jgi:hypothetical protein